MRGHGVCGGKRFKGKGRGEKNNKFKDNKFKDNSSRLRGRESEAGKEPDQHLRENPNLKKSNNIRSDLLCLQTYGAPANAAALRVHLAA